MKCRCGHEIEVDAVVDHDVWAQISPTGDEGGLLCANCMVHELGDVMDWPSVRMTNSHAAKLDVVLQTMKLSDDREEFWVRIKNDGRTFDVRCYGQRFRNRAEYEVAMLRHVLLGEEKPDLMDERYKDVADPTFDLGQKTGVFDATGREIRLGDRVLYRLQGKHTKKEYWNPEYVVVYAPPAFTLLHVGGGKDGTNHDFILRSGGGNGDLVVIKGWNDG